MSIKKYEIFLQTADLGSFTKASEMLGYTQSAISHIITSLEDELGVKLLLRDRFGVRLTQEGQQLLPAIPDKLDGHLRVGQGHPLDHREDGGPLGGVLFHKLQPGGGVEEQVPDHHGRAQGTARLLHLAGDSPLQAQAGSQRGFLGAAHHLHPGDR